MDKGEIVGAIIGLLLIIGFFGAIIYSGFEADKGKKTKEQVYINLMLENERLKTIQDLEERN